MPALATVEPREWEEPPDVDRDLPRHPADPIVGGRRWRLERVQAEHQLGELGGGAGREGVARVLVWAGVRQSLRDA